MDTVYDYFMGYSMGYLGWDDKLYIGNWHGLGKTMSVIDSPDNKGVVQGGSLRFPVLRRATTHLPTQLHLGKVELMWLGYSNQYRILWRSTRQLKGGQVVLKNFLHIVANYSFVPKRMSWI